MQYDQLFTALSKAQAELTGGKAQGVNPMFKSPYAKLEDIWEEIRIPFAKHGLCVIQNMGMYEGKWCILTILGHTSGQHITSYTPIMEVQGAKNPAQAFGSAITYAKRYGLASATGFSISDNSDDDGEACIGTDNPVTLKLTQAQIKELSGLAQSVPGVKDELHRRLGANIGGAIINQTQAFYHDIVAFAKKVEAFRDAS
jgi:hypothetical protein